MAVFDGVPALRVFSPFYEVIVCARTRAYLGGWLRRRSLPCPVVCIGNITLGGSGKTPLVMAAARRLLAMGRRPVVVSRGYGRRKKSDVVVVSDGSKILTDWEMAGDEPFLIARSLQEVPVIVGANRYEAGLTAVREFSPDAIVLDDGFQHLRLRRDLDFLVFDATKPLGALRMFPGGVLREPLEACVRAHGFILSKCNVSTIVPSFEEYFGEQFSDKPCLKSELTPVGLGSIGGDEATNDDLSALKGERIVACCGIGNPSAFLSLLREATGAEIMKEALFDDHHRFNREDVARLEEARRRLSCRWIVVTEKDAVKLSSLGLDLSVWRSLRVESRFSPSDEKTLDGMLRGLFVAKDDRKRG